MDHIGSLLLGLGNGGVYAALALALVLTYRSSGVINFATGAIALYSAYTYAFLRDGELLILVPGLPTSVDVGGPLGFAPAALIALAATALFGALLYLIVFRPLREAPPLARAVASLGVLLVIQAMVTIRLGSAPISVDSLFPSDRWEWGSLALLSDRFYLVVAVAVLTLVITAAYRWTRFGLVTRAAAESQTGAVVSGVSPDRVALANWMISAAVAGAAGILIAPLSPLTPVTYTLFVVPALAAAVVGGFRHLVPTVVAGIVIGMLQAEAVSLTAQYSWMPASGASEVVPLLVILVALLVTGRAIPVRGGFIRQPLGRAPRPRFIALPMVVGTLLGVMALLLTEGNWRSAVIATFISGVIGLSYVVVTGYAGQVSLAQLALAGAGAFTLSAVTQSWGVPFPFAPILAALAATVVGVVVGLPALRVRGLTLGIVTLALAYAIEAVWFRNTDIISVDGARVDQPELFGIDLSVGTGQDFPRIQFGLLCLAVLVLVAWAVARLRTSAFGSAMLAVRANERSAAGIGINVVRVKVLSFAIASFVAGLGGSLYAYRRSVVTHESFTAVGGLTLLSTAYLAGITSVSGGVIAGLMAAGGITFFAMEQGFDLGEWWPVLSGVAVIATVIGNPEGLATIYHRLSDAVADRRARAEAPAAPTRREAQVETAWRSPETEQEVLLDAAGLTVRYGGVVAVHDVSLQVPAGSIVGLIGPNGAGKTSAIDALAGFAAAEGTVRLRGERIEGRSPHQRVRLGLGRTFQSLELYDDLTVDENVSAALFGHRSESRRRRVGEVLGLLGIDALRMRPAGDLSQGERQLVSIARACASAPAVLLLDEPAAGLDTTESRWLAERIRGIAAAGVGVLLVDHDIALVLDTCDRIYVLDFGRVIAEGPPDVIRSDPAVADAYLGARHEVGGEHEAGAENDAARTP
ncbi:MAG TPA: branched-chain amino acid ABC transporter permease/ATP-binding protein [Acidimicrobiales bacterium]|nr:branched-chain amino acid ABC transporter permease/ATP-binding protein [Acidimicrobiales bacterium]